MYYYFLWLSNLLIILATVSKIQMIIKIMKDNKINLPMADMMSLSFKNPNRTSGKIKINKNRNFF